jgi:hypothetical protein
MDNFMPKESPSSSPQKANGNYTNMIFCVFKKENGKEKNVLVRPNMG